jgi:chromosome segregation ATPase
MLFALFVALASTAQAYVHGRDAGKTKDSVISKIIDMLEANKDKISEDIAGESKIMAEYFEWCDTEQSETAYGIRTATSKIEDLNAKIQDTSAEIAGLDDEIAKLGSEIAERQTEIDDANALREKQKAEFKVREEEQQFMIEELEQMEVELKKQMAAMTTPPPVTDAPTTEEAAGASLLQRNHKPQHLTALLGGKHDPASLARLQRALTEMVNAVWVDPQSQKALGVVHGLLQEDGLQEPEATPVPTVELGADQVDQMNQNSNDNLAAFEMLKGKAEEALSKMREAENTEQHNHDLRIQSLTQAIHLAEDKTDDAKKDHSRISEEKADAEHELVETQASKAADEKTLAGLKHECDEGATNWDTRQKEAKAEQAAIMKAKDILASRVTVLVQQGAKGQEPVDVAKFNAATQRTREVLIDHFRMLGSELHSIAMLNLVSVASQEPMAQVKGLLKDLIGKLTKEAAEAASLHEFCKEEKTKTAEAKDKKNDLIDKLETRLDKATSKSTSLKEKIATLSGEISESETAVAEATKIRTAEHATFVKQEADYKEAADAVEDAIDALKDYYGETGTFVQTKDIHVHHTAALVQDKHKAPPALGGAKSDAAGGILSIMSTMQAEFRKEVSRLQNDEREAVKAHDTFLQDSKVSKAAKGAEIKAATSEVKSLAVAIKNIGEDHKLASNELHPSLNTSQN